MRYRKFLVAYINKMRGQNPNTKLGMYVLDNIVIAGTQDIIESIAYYSRDRIIKGLQHTQKSVKGEDLQYVNDILNDVERSGIAAWKGAIVKATVGSVGGRSDSGQEDFYADLFDFILGKGQKYLGNDLAFSTITKRRNLKQILASFKGHIHNIGIDVIRKYHTHRDDREEYVEPTDYEDDRGEVYDTYEDSLIGMYQTWKTTIIPKMKRIKDKVIRQMYMKMKKYKGFGKVDRDEAEDKLGFLYDETIELYTKMMKGQLSKAKMIGGIAKLMGGSNKRKEAKDFQDIFLMVVAKFLTEEIYKHNPDRFEDINFKDMMTGITQRLSASENDSVNKMLQSQVTDYVKPEEMVEYLRTKRKKADSNKSDIDKYVKRILDDEEFSVEYGKSNDMMQKDDVGVRVSRIAKAILKNNK